MSWMDLAPERFGTRGMRSVPVWISARTNAVHVVIWPKLIEGLDWLREGVKVRAMLGRAEHAKMLRLMPGGEFRLGRTGGPRQDVLQRHSVIIPRLPGMAPGKHKPVPVPEFDYGADWLELTLPPWALPAPATAQATPAVREAAPIANVRPLGGWPKTVLVDHVDGSAAGGRPIR